VYISEYLALPRCLLILLLYDIKLPISQDHIADRAPPCRKASTGPDRANPLDALIMAPSAVEEQVAPTEIPILPGKAAAAATSTKPWLKSTGVLDKFEHIEVTPVIGREYPKADVAEWLQAPNSDELIKELALTSKFP
jgi:hypothetical protein